MGFRSLVPRPLRAIRVTRGSLEPNPKSPRTTGNDARVFGHLRRITAIQGREDTGVWYQETTFSQMVSYDFLLHGALHGYFLYLVSAPPEKPTRRCEPEEGYAIRLIIGVTL